MFVRAALFVLLASGAALLGTGAALAGPATRLGIATDGCRLLLPVPCPPELPPDLIAIPVGTPFPIGAQALDAGGALADTTISFTTSDPLGTVPPPYHQMPGVTQPFGTVILYTPGAQTVTAHTDNGLIAFKNIFVEDAATIAVPALGTGSKALLALALAGLGTFFLQRRT